MALTLGFLPPLFGVPATPPLAYNTAGESLGWGDVEMLLLIFINSLRNS